jgi:hypothetical protein
MSGDVMILLEGNLPFLPPIPRRKEGRCRRLSFHTQAPTSLRSDRVGACVGGRIMCGTVHPVSPAQIRPYPHPAIRSFTKGRE